MTSGITPDTLKKMMAEKKAGKPQGKSAPKNKSAKSSKKSKSKKG